MSGLEGQAFSSDWIGKGKGTEGECVSEPLTPPLNKQHLYKVSPPTKCEGEQDRVSAVGPGKNRTEEFPGREGGDNSLGVHNEKRGLGTRKTSRTRGEGATGERCV